MSPPSLCSPWPLGVFLSNVLIRRLYSFTNSTGDAKPVYLEFGHDTTIDMALTGLGLAKDSPKLSAKGPVRSNRKFRTSYQVPFAAQMLWEKFSCTSSFDGPQVRLVLNDAPFPLATVGEAEWWTVYLSTSAACCLCRAVRVRADGGFVCALS